MSSFAIVWNPMSAEIVGNWGLPVETGVSLPFFVDGEALRALEQREPAPLLPFNLLRGILIAYEQEAPFLDIASIRPSMRRVLEHLGRGFGLDSPEQTVLSAAAKLRAEHGSRISRVALETGARLYPSDSRIRSDLVVDLWTIAETAAPEDYGALFEQIRINYRAIDFQLVDPRSIEFSVFAHYVALRFLGLVDESERFLAQVVMQHVDHPAYKQRIRYLWEGNPFDMAKLAIVTASDDGR